MKGCEDELSGQKDMGDLQCPKAKVKNMEELFSPILAPEVPI